LPGEQAIKALPAKVVGVVTAAEKYWEGRFFVHDASGGVFVDNISPQQPEVGDIVEVSGVSHPGAFAPIIAQPQWKVTGRGPLPSAKAVAVERLMAGVEDGQRVEITGTVRTAVIEHDLLSIDLVSSGYRFHVFARKPKSEDGLDKMIGASARVRGTAAASFNAQLRQLITAKIFAPLADDFVIEAPESVAPEQRPVLTLSGVAQYRQNDAPGTRARVRGTLTCQRPGEDLFLADASGGLRVKTKARKFLPGTVIEAIGFPELEHYLPVLNDALCRKVEEKPMDVVPRHSSAEELQGGLHHGDLITVRVRLLDRSVRRTLDRTSEGLQVKTHLTLQADNLAFMAEMESNEEPAALVAIPLGSLIEVTGVCLSEIDEDGKLKVVKLLLPATYTVQVIERPGWLTPERVGVGLGIASVVLIAAAGWIVIGARRNVRLHRLVQEKQEAQRQLQVAHQRLEERVKERTEQLKQQITARKETELNFKAVLSERTRLAQELHDTLEQTLTGIALQMDTADRLVEAEPDAVSHHLGLARKLVGQGQSEVRRSVWDLRSRNPGETSLQEAIAKSCRQLTDGTGIEVLIRACGQTRRLPEVASDNLLRIAQEAVTNAIKHSGGTKVHILLDYLAETVALEAHDNGHGFSPEACPGPLTGHFGLLGISERVNRLGGKVAINSTAEIGTILRVEIPSASVRSELPLFAGLDV
jgi:signal transduction histidine kinase